MKLLILLTLILSACNWGISYTDDISFLSSAQANSMEFDGVYLNGSRCLDIRNNNNACAINAFNNEDIKIKIEGRPYSYRFNLRCSADITSIHYNGTSYSMPFAKDVVNENEVVELVFTPNDYQSTSLFICYGEAFPYDRDQKVSNRFFISIIIKDSKYTPREIIFTKNQCDKTGIILGKYAMYGTVCIDGNCKQYKNTPVAEYKTKDIAGKKIVAWSESYTMRTNRYEQ